MAPPYAAVRCGSLAVGVLGTAEYWLSVPTRGRVDLGQHGRIISKKEHTHP